METEIEIWRGTQSTAPYRWLVRDAQPPRYWYGALDNGQGELTFERLPDTRLAEQSDAFGEPATEAERAAVVEAFRQQVLDESP